MKTSECLEEATSVNLHTPTLSSSVLCHPPTALGRTAIQYLYGNFMSLFL